MNMMTKLATVSVLALMVAAPVSAQTALGGTNDITNLNDRIDDITDDATDDLNE